MNNNEIFPPAIARVLFVSCKDFPDDLQETKYFFFCNGDVLSDPEIGFAVKSINPQAAVEESIFKRVVFRTNGRSYPFYVDRKNFDFVMPIINNMIVDGIRKGKEEYEWKIKQKDDELEARLKYLNSIDREFTATKRYLAESLETLAKIRESRSYRFMHTVDTLQDGLSRLWNNCKSFYKYRIRIERKNEDE